METLQVQADIEILKKQNILIKIHIVKIYGKNPHFFFFFFLIFLTWKTSTFWWNPVSESTFSV